MDFRECLSDICSRVEGAVVASLMGMDGLAVASVDHPQGEDPIDVASLLIEYSSVLGQVRQSAQVFSAGALQEVTICSGRLNTLIRPVTDEYFLALALLPSASVGKGRYLLRVTAPKLVSELA